MVRLNRPELLTTVEIVLLLPTATLPKLRVEAVEVEELRTICPATAIEHQTTLSKTAFDQEPLRGKPRYFIVPPLMLVLAHGGGYGATAVRSGPPRIAGDQTHALQFPHALFPLPRCDRSRKGMQHYTLVHTSARPEPPKVVCYWVCVSTGRRKLRGLGEGIGLIEDECAGWRGSSLWKSAGSSLR
jgi:hypothetical protein